MLVKERTSVIETIILDVHFSMYGGGLQWRPLLTRQSPLQRFGMQRQSGCDLQYYYACSCSAVECSHCFVS